MREERGDGQEAGIRYWALVKDGGAASQPREDKNVSN